MKALVLDFIRLDQSHTGEYLASKLTDCLQEFNIMNKVCVHDFSCTSLVDIGLAGPFHRDRQWRERGQDV